MFLWPTYACRVAASQLVHSDSSDFQAEPLSSFNRRLCQTRARDSPVGPAARFLKWSSTNRRIAEDRLPCWRFVSISLTSSDSVTLSSSEISFMLVQNGSSRLTLVLWPPTTIERFTTVDFIGRLLHAWPIIYHTCPAVNGFGLPVGRSTGSYFHGGGGLGGAERSGPCS